MTSVIDKPLTRFRTTPARGAQPVVNRVGGHFGAGLITGAAAITRGEALGHYAWIDTEAVDQVVAFGNKARNGIKVRFTHPGLSADGMGSLLGRMKSFRRDGERAVGDIHFEKSAHSTPDGDLANYVMDLAEEDPEAFGMSIVFEHDVGEEDRHEAEHENEDGHFTSPDEQNENNYRHIRLAKLLAADVVDDPAANPAGLFRKGHSIADEADRLCEYALGLSGERPKLRHLSADADRLAQYAARFLESHNLQLRSIEMPESTKNEPAGVTLEQLNSFGETLLAKVDEKLATLKPQETSAVTAPSTADSEKAGAERLEKLQALAQTAGLANHEKVGRKWFDQGLSFESAQAAVEPLMVKQNPLTTDTGDQPADIDAKYKAEYAKQRAAFASMGLSEAEYVTSRRVDDGAELLGAKVA